MNIDTLAKICNEIELVDKDFIRSSFHPYVYFVRGKKGSKFENKFYISSKSKVNVRDTNGVIGEDYFTSSSQKEFVDDFTLHPENYQSTIIHASDDYGDKISQTRKNKSAEEKAATRLKLQAAAKVQSERMTEEQKAEVNAKRSFSVKEKFAVLKEAYAAYKNQGGELKWNEWQKSQKRS